MISEMDEEMLVTPLDNRKKEKAGIPKIFKGFIRNREEDYE